VRELVFAHVGRERVPVTAGARDEQGLKERGRDECAGVRAIEMGVLVVAQSEHAPARAGRGFSAEYSFRHDLSQILQLACDGVGLGKLEIGVDHEVLGGELVPGGAAFRGRLGE
jgi:hypothetical protein